MSSTASPTAKAPKVFLSHAREDKDRFVLRFARALRDRGVDAWVDKWEILPGDSLVDKIFEEGLKDADAVIVVLSQFSVCKPWVKEELNAAVVRRITKRSKLIPVVIDDCDIPESLQNLVWERVPDLDNFQQQLANILAAVFDYRDKPPLGDPPAYLEQQVTVSGLTTIDTLVFRALYDHAILTNKRLWQPSEIGDKLPDVTQEQLLDAFEILEHHGYVEIKRLAGGVPRGIGIVQPTLSGFLNYADNFLPSIKETIRQLGLAILNSGLRSDAALEQATHHPLFLIDKVLEYFELRGWLTMGRTIGHMHIVTVSPLLKREFQ